MRPSTNREKRDFFLGAGEGSVVGSGVGGGVCASSDD